MLGFREMVTVKKHRERFVFKGDFEICLDSVEDLGYFIEIESLRDFGGVEKTRGKLLEFAEALGLKDQRMDKRGYPYELMKKRGLLG